MKSKSIRKIFFVSLLCTSGLACAQTPSASGNYRIDMSGDVYNDTVLYSIGGGSASGAPVSFYRPGGFEIGIGWETNLMCGNFDLSTTIGNQLNGLTNGFQQLMGQVLNAATGAVASLPAMILQRANPGLYELISNGILQGRIDFDKSMLTCRNMAEKMTDVITGNGWGQIANAQGMQQATKTQDAVQAVDEYEEEKGNNGVAWMGGKNAGGKGQPPIQTTTDIIKAGYNALHNRGEDDNSPISPSSCQGGAVCTAFASPDDAVEFAKRVLGEEVHQTCQGCPPVKSTSGAGLTPIVQEEYEKRRKTLEDMVSGRTPITQDKLNSVSSSMLPVTRSVVEALQSDPDRAVLTQRLASEVALTEVMGKGMLLQRQLVAGSRNPNVVQAKPAMETTKQNIDTLTLELNSLQAEMNLRKTVAANTTSQILARQQMGQGVSRSTQPDDPQRNRVDEMEKEP